MKSSKFFQSPPPTPERKDKRSKIHSKKDEEGDFPHMKATFRTVGYQSESEVQEVENIRLTSEQESVFHPNTRKKLSKGKLDLVDFIRKHYLVPKDFETDTSFGPFSGLCFEDRLITSYEWKKFKPQESFRKRHESKHDWKVCWKCSLKADHLAREGCPEEKDNF